MTRIAVGIMGGLSDQAGPSFVDAFRSRKFPFRELRVIESSEYLRTEPRIPSGLTLRSLDDASAFAGLDLVIATAGSNNSLRYVPEIVKAGVVVIDNTRVFRMRPECPLVVPEVNPEGIFKHQGIICNPNCTTLLVAVVLGVIERTAKLTRVYVASYQCVSGTSAEAEDELVRLTRDNLEGRAEHPSVYPCSIAFNVIPFVEAIEPNGFSVEEMKVINETQKILRRPDLPVGATCVRVPTFHAHASAVYVETERTLPTGVWREALSRAPGLRVVDDPTTPAFPTPRTHQGDDYVYVGRIRADLFQPNGLHFWTTGDHMLKGSVTNGVQIAEILFGVDKESQ